MLAREGICYFTASRIVQSDSHSGQLFTGNGLSDAEFILGNVGLGIGQRYGFCGGLAASAWLIHLRPSLFWA